MEKINNTILLNPAQKEALNSFNNSKNNKTLIVLPSGVGKTILSAIISKNVKGNVLFLVHRNEILKKELGRVPYKKEFAKLYPKTMWRYVLRDNYDSVSYHDFLKRQGDFNRYIKEIKRDKPKYSGVLLDTMKRKRTKDKRRFVKK